MLSKLENASRAICCLALVLCLGACGQKGPDGNGSTPQIGLSVDAKGDPKLTKAALEVVGFLQGSNDFENLQVAPMVTLQLAREGGGDRAEVPRESLRSLENWRVRSESAESDYSFVPPSGSTILVAREGRHFNCLEYDLASRAEPMGQFPYVGTQLAPEEGASCLEVWNVTFVFDPAGNRPVLIGAVYDQWEW